MGDKKVARIRRRERKVRKRNKSRLNSSVNRCFEPFKKIYRFFSSKWKKLVNWFLVLIGVNEQETEIFDVMDKNEFVEINRRKVTDIDQNKGLKEKVNIVITNRQINVTMKIENDKLPTTLRTNLHNCDHIRHISHNNEHGLITDLSMHGIPLTVTDKDTAQIDISDSWVKINSVVRTNKRLDPKQLRRKCHVSGKGEVILVGYDNKNRTYVQIETKLYKKVDIIQRVGKTLCRVTINAIILAQDLEDTILKGSMAVIDNKVLMVVSNVFIENKYGLYIIELVSFVPTLMVTNILYEYDE